MYEVRRPWENRVLNERQYSSNEQLVRDAEDFLRIVLETELKLTKASLKVCATSFLLPACTLIFDSLSCSGLLGHPGHSGPRSEALPPRDVADSSLWSRLQAALYSAGQVKQHLPALTLADDSFHRKGVPRCLFWRWSLVCMCHRHRRAQDIHSLCRGRHGPSGNEVCVAPPLFESSTLILNFFASDIRFLMPAPISLDFSRSSSGRLVTRLRTAICAKATTLMSFRSSRRSSARCPRYVCLWKLSMHALTWRPPLCRPKSESTSMNFSPADPDSRRRSTLSRPSMRSSLLRW